MLDKRKAAPFLAIGLLTFALAGCTGGSERSFTVPAEADPVARQANVTEPHRVEVHVTLESGQGRPLPGVGVVFFREAGEGQASVSTSVSASGQDASAQTQTEVTSDAGGYEALASGRTPSNGTVTGFIAPNTTVHVLAGGATGFTQEALFRVPVGQAGGTTELSLPLYHEHLNFDGNTSIPTTASTSEATMGQTEPERYPVEIPLAEPDAVEEAYLERLARVDIAITWTNEPPTHADLYAGWGAGDEVFVTGEDTRQEPGEGEVTEIVSVETSTIDEHRDALVEAGSMSAFVLTDDVAASPDGVEVTINGTTTFHGTGHAFTIRG